jgi:hypothetical protein
VGPPPPRWEVAWRLAPISPGGIYVNGDGSLIIRLALPGAQSLPIDEPEGRVPQSATYPYVRAFSRVMEYKLGVNRHKGSRGDWCEDEPRDLLERVKQELTELLIAVFERHSEEEVAWEAADVANMAMMVADSYVNKVSEGTRSIIDVTPEEWTIAPVHGGIKTYENLLHAWARAVAQLGNPTLAMDIRNTAAELVAYVEGL